MMGICSDITRVSLTSAAYIHLKHSDVSKHTRNLSPASRAILLSGPAGMQGENMPCNFSFEYHLSKLISNLVLLQLSSEELYQQMLAKALAHYFESKLLLLDVPDFSLKVSMQYIQIFYVTWLRDLLIFSMLCLLQIQSKYGCTKKESVSILFPPSYLFYFFFSFKKLKVNQTMQSHGMLCILNVEFFYNSSGYPFERSQ